MKFPETNIAVNKTLHIPSLTGGLDFSFDTHNADSSTLKECENIWEQGGILETRPALTTTTQRIIPHSGYSGGDYYTRSATKIEIDIEGDIKRLILEEIDYDISAYICLTHLISSDGSVYNTASLHFQRVSSDVFYIPQRINFFKGEPENGCGVFAVMGMVNCENNTEKEGRIFELSEDYSHWEQVYSPYIPTVLINGRGNKYEKAKYTNQAFSGTPTRLEGLNALEGTFHAYYSTDGFSSSFRLPFAGISNDRVVCRLYYSVESFTQWIIEEGQTSASATLYNVSVTMHINREKGIVYFTVPAGEYEMPLISDRNENNLRITATKEIGFSLKDLSFSDVCVFSHNRIYLGCKNRVFLSYSDNPLYFPVDSSVMLGSDDERITALGFLKEKLIAFKRSKVYSIALNFGKRINTTSLLAENDTQFYTNDTLTPNTVSANVGCREMTSVLEGEDIIYWLGNDYRFYSLNASGKVSCILGGEGVSLILNPQAYSKITAISLNGSRIFFTDYKALVLETHPENKDRDCWYYWEFPEDIRIIGGFLCDNKPNLLCREINSDLCFTGVFGGTDDIYLSRGEEGEVETAAPINSYIRTNKLSLGCDNSFKKINELILQLSGRVQITVNDRWRGTNYNDELETVRLMVGICDVNLIDIALRSKERLRLKSIDIKYTGLSL